MLLSRLHVLITGDNRDAQRALRDTNRAMTATAAHAKTSAGVWAGALNTLTKLSLAVTGVGLATGAIVGVGAAATGAIGGLTAGALALVSAATVAGAGLAAFGVLAAGALDGVGSAMGSYEAATKSARQALAVGDMEAYNAALLEQKQALATLNPAQADFAMNVMSLKDAWREAGDAIGPSLFATLNKAVDTSRNLLPSLIPVADSVSVALGNMFGRANTAIGGERFQNFIALLADTAGPILERFGGILGNIGGSFANAFEAGLPLIDAVLTGLTGITESMESAFAGPGFAEFVRWGVDILPLVGDTLGDVAGAVLALLTALEPLAPVALGAISAFAGALEEAFRSDDMQAFVGQVARLFPVIADTLGDLAQAFVRVLGSDAFVEFVDGLVQLLPQLVEPLALLAQGALEIGSAFVAALLPVMPVLTDALRQILPPLVELATALFGVGSTLLVALLPPLADLIVALAGPLTDLLTIAAGMVEKIAPYWSAWGDAMVAFMDAALPGLVSLAQAISDAFTPEIIQRATDAVVGMTPSIVSLGESFAELLLAVGPFLPDLVELGVTLLELLVPALENAARTVEVLTDVFGPLFEFGLAWASNGLGNLIWAFEKVGGVLEWIADRAEDLIGLLGGVAGAAGKVGGGGLNLGPLKYANPLAFAADRIFDDGGVMPGPRGEHNWALVAGGETIVPTHKPGVSLDDYASGGTVHVEGGVHVTVGSGDPEAVKAAVMDALAEAARGGRGTLRQTRG
ncbi:hypothetical protein [Blastococcus mobilis]|uniref:Phage-related protein n=1 Tax=Blastococcus mobilis TaxID=1938746 RepID=A0A238VX39_9ACTN|nr:hypothetical protein [Blastococcus mobilis]SNR38707.1 hypothetical protein SAMN06272737_105114 [Blastococcus mobilis]